MNADTNLRNINPCPTETGYSSNAITHSFTSGSVSFLRNAVEILHDGIGDDDGFCESNETCLYTPNIGAYQGHGNLISASTTSSSTKTCSDLDSSGTIKNVKLLKYETNGY